MAKLNGIRSAKSKYAAFLRNQKPAPPIPAGALNPAWHVPSPGADGTLVCSCGGARYTPAAYAEHIAGKAMIDGEGGVYIASRNDPWLSWPAKAAAPEPIDPLTDADGWLIEPFENDLHQRMVRYLTGPKAGCVEHAPTFALSPAEPQRRPIIAHGTDPGMT